MKFTSAAILSTFAFLYATAAYADTFGSGLNTFEIEFVPIGNPGNAADTAGIPNPAGSVPYAYRMGKFEISRGMLVKANAEGGLGITLHPMDFLPGGPRDDMPATGVNWYEAARFVNWLNDQKGASPAYKFNGSAFELWQPGDAGYNPANLFRNSQAFYFLPSFDEWYKAAYYDPSAGVYFTFPTGSNTAPTPVASGTAPNTAVYDQPSSQGPADITLAGGLSPYGTMGQGGNVREWGETKTNLVNDSTSSPRVPHGGYWGSDSFGLTHIFPPPRPFPAEKRSDMGFRVASIPEPSTMLLGALATLGVLMGRRR